MPRRKSKPRIVRMPAGDLKPGLTSEDRDLVKKSLQSTVSDSTKDVYRKHFAYFDDWCLPKEIDPMEADAEHVQTYLSQMFWIQGLSVSSVQCAASAIKKTWLWGDAVKKRDPRKSDCDWEAVLNVVDGLRKVRRGRPSQATGLTWPLFQDVLKNVGKRMEGESPRKAARRAAFDIALIAVMKDLLTRRKATSELVWGDIELKRPSEGSIFGAVTIPLGKADRDGRPPDGVSVHRHAGVPPADGGTLRARHPRPGAVGVRHRRPADSNRIRAACKHAGLKGNFLGAFAP